MLTLTIVVPNRVLKLILVDKRDTFGKMCGLRILVVAILLVSFLSASHAQSEVAPTFVPDLPDELCVSPAIRQDELAPNQQSPCVSDHSCQGWSYCGPGNIAHDKCSGKCRGCMFCRGCSNSGYCSKRQDCNYVTIYWRGHTWVYCYPSKCFNCTRTRIVPWCQSCT